MLAFYSIKAQVNLSIYPSNSVNRPSSYVEYFAIVSILVTFASFSLLQFMNQTSIRLHRVYSVTIASLQVM